MKIQDENLKELYTKNEMKYFIKEYHRIQKDLGDLENLFVCEYERCPKCGNYKRVNFGCDCGYME